MLSSKAALGAGSIVVDSKLYGLYNLLRKGARGSRLFSLVLPKQDVVGSNPFTRSTFYLVEIRGYTDCRSPLSD